MRKYYLIILLTISTTANSATIFKAVYKLKWGMMTIGKVVRILNKTDNIYSFSSDTKPEGLAKFLTDGVSEKSVFKIINHKLHPISYTLNEPNKKNLHYQYLNNHLFVSGDKNLTLDNIPNNSADYLNMVIFIMHALENGQSKFIFTEHENPNKPETLTFLKKSNSTISVSAGRFEVILVEKLQTKGVKFKMWLSPKYHYLPIKFNIINLQGQEFNMELTNFTITK